MEPWSRALAGRFDERVFESQALEGNPLGDPWQRPIWVYVPPGYDDEPDRRYPSVYVIQGYTLQLDMWRNRSPFGAKTYPELCDDLFASGEAPATIVVWVDAWTALGGSQFVDSPAIGRYHTYLCEDVVPWVDERYRTLAARALRAVYIDAGKSDEYYLDLGAEAFRAVLEQLGVRDVFFELFDGKHGGIIWRYPLALKFLAERLAPA